MNIFKELGLKEVVNASGKMTALGVSTSTQEVSGAVKAALENFVILKDMISYTGDVIAKTTKAPGGCPSASAAAGIVVSIAACIAGKDITRIEKLPDSSGLKNEVIIQKGHLINFGANIGQMIRLGGGVVVEVGAANRVQPDNIENSITDKTAVLFYTQSHHAVQKGMVSLADMIKIGKRRNIPVVVDAAAEEDLQKYAAIGADLVIYSGGKALCGPTSGLICGNKELTEACKMQYEGIGRAMKVSKEGMAGLVVALNNYNPEDSQPEIQKAKAEKMRDGLNNVSGLTCRVTKDEAGREIYRTEVKVDEAVFKMNATDLDKKLQSGNPAIFLRNHNANIGLLYIDARQLSEGQDDAIIKAISQAVC